MDTNQFINKNSAPAPAYTDGSSFNEYYKALEKHSLENHRLFLKFKEAFFKHLDIVTNPRRERFFSKCWALSDNGSGSDFDKVVHWGETLVDIIR